METNKSVQHLDLSSNLLDPPCADPLRRMLSLNRSLRTLSVACNGLEDQGVRIVWDGLSGNQVAQRVDVRLTGTGLSVSSRQYFALLRGHCGEVINMC